jgi:hypothetical protein
MGRYRFGEGDYAYFAYPLPPAVERLRRELYRPWPTWPTSGAAGWVRPGGSRGPATSTDAGAVPRRRPDRPTPLVLRYGPGGYNTLHQDLYGDVASRCRWWWA